MIKRFCLLIIIVLLPWQTIAQKLDFSGFGTLGLVTSDSKTHGYRKDVRLGDGVFDGDIDFRTNSLLGFQVETNLTSSIDFVGQAIIRDLPKSSFDRYITLAFLRFNLSPNWQIRVGRTAPDLFLMTEYRNVDFSFPWSTAPNEVYGIVPNQYIDGADITYSHRLDGATLSTKMFYGQSEVDVSGLGTTETLEFNNIVGVSVSVDAINWTLQLKHTDISFGNQIEGAVPLVNAIKQLPETIWPNAVAFANQINLEGDSVAYSSINGQFIDGNWQVISELSYINSDNILVPKTISAYLGASYQIGMHQLYALYARTKADVYAFDEPNVQVAYIPEIIESVTSTLNFYTTNQHTLSLGWRWDLSNNVATKLQYNHSKIDGRSAALWWTPTGDLQNETVNTLMFSVSFVF